MSTLDVETILRDAYRARAEGLDESTLRPALEFTDPVAPLGDVHDLNSEPYPARRRWWRSTTLLAAAAVLLLAGVVVALLVVPEGHNGQPITPPSPTLSMSTSAAPTPTSPAPTQTLPAETMLSLGKVGSRREIPWSLVADGWTVALWAPTVPKDGAYTQSLFLVDPQGGRYLITTLVGSDLRIQDVSGDHRRVLITDWSSYPQTTFHIIDLASARDHVVTRPAHLQSAEFTKPEGKAIVIGGRQLERTDLDGNLEHMYFADDGKNPEEMTSGAYPGGLPVYSPDGASLVVVTNSGLTYMSNDGSGARALVIPDLNSACSVLRWWDAGDVLVWCGFDGSFVVPLDGGPPRPLAQTAPGTDMDIYDAWNVPSGVIGVSLAPCGGGGQLYRIAADGTTASMTIDLPGVTKLPLHPTGVTSTDAFVRGNATCQLGKGIVLARISLATGVGHVLLGGKVGGGSVLSAQTMSEY